MKKPHILYEKEIWSQGGLVCGIDEVGRGSVAGPVVAAAVIMPRGHKPISFVNDSKKLSAKKREELFMEILSSCADFGVGLASAQDVDKYGISEATQMAMREAFNSLTIMPQVILIDAVKLKDTPLEQKSIVKGDQICYSISCASIIAKVFRDHVVMGLDHEFPNYNFSSHKGYGTKKHFEAIEKEGTTPEHRKTFIHTD